jgi:protein-S-isoprenylcysteine O-methyltransferase Ste14
MKQKGADEDVCRPRDAMAIEIKIAILILTSLCLAILTRRSLKSLRSHGVYRLLAWIGSIALVLLNVEHWFEEPLAVHQIVSWLLLLLSLFLVTYAVLSLRRGRSGINRDDPSLIGVEKTTELVATGAYRYVRHPMYGSFLPGVVGVYLKDMSGGAAFLTCIVIACTIVAAKTEEKENLAYFGDAYRDYMEHTRMFIPFLF